MSQARSFGSMMKKPVEGSWSYIAKRREIQAGKQLFKPKVMAVSPSTQAHQQSPIWEKVYSVRHGQTKL